LPGKSYILPGWAALFPHGKGLYGYWFLTYILNVCRGRIQDLIVEIVDEREDLPRFKESLFPKLGLSNEGDYLFQRIWFSHLINILLSGAENIFSRGVLTPQQMREKYRNRRNIFEYGKDGAYVSRYSQENGLQTARSVLPGNVS
jgi:hypothetical protein